MSYVQMPALMIAILCLGALILAVLPLPGRVLSRLGCVVGALSGLVAVAMAALVWSGSPADSLGGPISTTWWQSLPLGLPASFAIQIDALSALFLLLLGLVSAVALLFAIGYLDGEEPGAVKRFLIPFLFLVAGMETVVMAADWVFFLFAWEIMTLSSYFLVIWNWRSAANAHAAWVYLLTTHMAGGGMMLAACALSVLAGDFSMPATTQALQSLFAQTPAYANLLVALLAIGFSAKGAVYPLSFWLPLAHSAAPAPVSAVMSGLMVKMGIYGLIRLFVFMVPAGGQTALVWGLVLATLGTLNMVIGNIRSLSEQHAKRLVAQSSVGQIGYIVLGLGMAVALAGRAPMLAALAFAGALFHLVNHAAFKSLLFLTVGAIERRTGTYDLRKMGGLVYAMPAVAAMTLLGALAIAGTPPLNGFASKWLLYRAAVFGGIEIPVLAIYGVIAIFISTVSLASYLKYFGTAFLGPQRGDLREARGAGEMTTALWILGAACLILGLRPAPVVKAALSALASSPSAALYGVGTATSDTILGSVLGGAAYQPLALLMALLVCAGLVDLVWRLGNQERRATKPWFGGEELPAAEVRYGSEHLYKPFLARYGLLLRPWWEPRLHAPQGLERAIDFDRWLVRPIYQAYDWLAARCTASRDSSPARAVAWQLLALVIVLAILIGTEGGLL